jgi:hypothetical protein
MQIPLKRVRNKIGDCRNREMSKIKFAGFLFVLLIATGYLICITGHSAKPGTIHGSTS